MKLINKFVVGLMSLLLVGLVFSFYISIQEAPPSNLILLADHKYKTYISPECLNENRDYTTSDYETVTLSDARSMNYKPDSTCTYDSINPSRNIAWNWIGTKLGIVKPLGWKWNDNGTWKEEALS